MSFYYHLTNLNNVPSILAEGLKPRKSGGLTKEGLKRKVGKIFLFVDESVARSAVGWHTTSPKALLKVKIPFSRLSKDRETDPESIWHEFIRVYCGNIPAKDIKYLGIVKEE